MPLPDRGLLLSDLVRDSRIEATVFANHTVQVVYQVGHSARQRRIRTEEVWVREGCLGRGAYGTVYKESCEEGPRSRVRAVKEIKTSVVVDEDVDHTRELEAIAKFSHPKYAHCFVRSDGWYQSEDAVYISMEYIRHGDLQRYLTRPIPESEAREMVSQVLEGLKHMHDNRFIHRDLKPGNIMVVDEGPHWWVKIADFGISKRRHEMTSLQTLQRGTFGFAAPEAVGFSRDDDDRAHVGALDMWSLGAVAFRIMTNTGAFPNFMELAEYCSGTRAFPVATLESCAISGEGQSFVAALMSLKPEHRPLADEARKHPWIPALASSAGIVASSAAIAAETP
ncbi:kinase-like domain-containing protein [Lasiosphaeris hirsuta]|uniref:Kinase-like domain-containing protein n=1 Tax=Lasiosphaeris hirsuta TaxID=260670 RepID=A0AA40DWH0_9PEZI|nr:kinase-like domain-containing protein [Lasiosphaeris hirsuta]